MRQVLDMNTITGEGSQETTKVTCDELTTRDFQALDPRQEFEALDVTCGDERFQHGQRLKKTQSLGGPNGWATAA